jgi:transposase-like protein
MTYQPDCTLPTDLLDHLTQGGVEARPDAIRLLLNTAMLLERQKFIGAGPYQRTAERQAHANGFKDKTLHTRLDALTVAVPQVRQGGFYPQSLEKGVRSERALKLALAEMYVQGVSTRKVAAITEQLCGFEVSSAQVSRAAAELDAVLDVWRTRPLGEYPYVYLDARYEKVRQDGQVRDAAGADRQWGGCCGQARGAGGVSSALGTGGALAHVPAGLTGARPARGATAH